jgi:Fe2+ or Zn2+ uptake regulation protein
MRWYNQNKYRNTKTIVDGITFDSRKEASRYRELKLLLEAGSISNLRCQEKFVLIPVQREPDIIGVRGGVKKGKVIEKECSYLADFVYEEDGQTVVEDTKGFRTKDYIIKRKLMLYFYGIKIKEI